MSSTPRIGCSILAGTQSLAGCTGVPDDASQCQPRTLDVVMHGTMARHEIETAITMTSMFDSVIVSADNFLYRSGVSR